ncbi:MAG: radical SAM protein [Pseudomonadota bacterium]
MNCQLGTKWQIGWGITKACNMRCSFCYSIDAREGKDTLNLDTLRNFISNNHNYIDSINYGTGENALTPIWFDLIDYARKYFPNILQALTTNGYLFEVVKNDSFYQNLVSRCINEIDVSLDYSNPNKHNKIRGHESAFEWAIGTLDFCTQANIKSTIVMIGIEDTLTKENLKGIFDVASQHNAMVRINLFRPTNNRLSPPSSKTVYKALSWIMKRYKVAVLSDPLFSSIFKQSRISDDMSGVSSLRILPTGDITPSTYLVGRDWIAGSILENQILDRIGERQQFALLRETVKPALCKECEFETTCKGGVKDRRILYYNALSERDPYCPFRENSNVDLSELPELKDMNVSNRISIHDGYLPTLIFYPHLY